METSVSTNGAVFTYKTVSGNYAIITGYRPKNGEILFTKSEDGYRRHYIEVPETVEGLPVVALSSFGLELETNGKHGYRHDGSTRLSLVLPEHTVFHGFGAFYDETGYFNPHYEVSYYQRAESELTFCENCGAVFLAKPLPSNTCKLIFIATNDKFHTQTLIIPPKLCGRKVIALDDECTYKLSPHIKTVMLSDDIREIGVNCFSGNLSLQTVYLGKNTEKISIGCFRRKDNDTLTVYYRKKPVWIDAPPYSRLLPFEQNEFVIEDGVLLKCSCNLPLLSLSAGLRSIADYALCDNPFVKSISLSEGVEQIGAYSFADCVALESINLPKTLKTIGKGAFKNCKSLRLLNLPEGIITLDSSLCENCTELSAVSLPKSLCVIEEKAFKSSGLREVDIPEDTVCIKYQAFADCKELRKVTIPKSLKALDVYTFSESGIDSEPFR